MSKKTYTEKFKLKVLREHNKNGVSFYESGKRYSIEPSIIRAWWHAFDAYGKDGLRKHNSDTCNYSADFKKMVVKEYLAGGISQNSLAKKHGIFASSTICTWVKKYNNHESLKESRSKGDFFMVKNNKSRRTTMEERIAIVEYCLANANNYAMAAKEFRCSYGQVYNWVRQYKLLGIEGLYDHRGRKKPTEELTDMEKLKVENRILKAHNKSQQMEIDFLKKLNAVERR